METVEANAIPREVGVDEAIAVRIRARSAAQRIQGHLREEWYLLAVIGVETCCENSGAIWFAEKVLSCVDRVDAVVGYVLAA